MKKLPVLPTDKQVEKMVKTWDVVKCKRCGKKISMANAKLIDEKYFVCKKCI